MKIAIVCPYNLDIPGGVQEHVLAEARELRRRKHEVIIVTPRPRRRKTKADPGVYYIGQMARLAFGNDTRTDFSATSDFEAINDFFESVKPDILHMHEPEVPMTSRQLLSQANCPVVGTFHAALPENFVGKRLASSFSPYINAVKKQITKFTIVSEAAAGLLGDIDVEPYKIPNGVDLKRYRPHRVVRDENMVLFVGRLEKRKGVIELLSIFQELKKLNPKARLEIAGGGPLWNRLHNLVEEMELKDVKFHGFVTDSEKMRLMSKCGVFTSPATHGESFGIVLIEAMAMGAPVVAGKNPGYSTVMTGRGAISIVDTQDFVAYARRLDLFMKDKKLTDLWRQWAKNSVKQYDWPIVVDKYEELFSKLA